MPSPFDEEMTSPAPRQVLTVPDTVMCEAALTSIQEHPPLHHRRGLATLRPRQVGRLGAARLLCDGLHDGPHRWPHVYETLITSVESEDSPGDGRDEIEILPE